MEKETRSQQELTYMRVAALADSAVYGQTGPRVCAGIVGSCDFNDPNLDSLLKAMLRVRNFRGIRSTRWGKDPNAAKSSGAVDSPTAGASAAFVVTNPGLVKTMGVLRGCSSRA